MCYSVGAPTGEAFIEPNQERASPKGPALFLFVHHSRKHPTAEGSPAIPIYPAPPKSALSLSRPLRCRKLSAGKCTHPLTPALLSARAAPGRGPYPNHSTALTPGTEAPGAAGRQPAQAPLFLFGGLRHLSSLGLSAGLGGGSAIPQPRPKCKGKMHGPAFIPFGRGRPCILSVPAASGGPPRGDGPPSLACRACGPSGWFGAPPFKKGPGAAGSPCGAVPALGRKRPAPWLAAGGPCGAGGACGHGPHHQRQLPPVALLGAPL